MLRRVKAPLTCAGTFGLSPPSAQRPVSGRRLPTARDPERTACSLLVVVDLSTRPGGIVHKAHPPPVLKLRRGDLVFSNHLELRA